ncbi:hypothetical protein B0H21DRAFT_822003 [Amylocystis lapponica]|nr:hypothetical protein B0H21DRAFT_822003 [Amylocystis lapponica]
MIRHLHSTTHDPLPDIIDDSEPEREERRRLRRLNKKRMERQPSPPAADVDIIELTDSDNTSPVVSNASLASAASVIEITDTSRSLLAPTPATNTSIPISGHINRPIEIDDDISGDNTSFPSVRAILQLPRDEPRVLVVQAAVHSGKQTTNAAAHAVPIPNSTRESTLSDSDGEDINRLKLTQFAYNRPSQLSRHASSTSKSSLSQSASTTPVEDPPAKKKAVRPASHRFTSDFSDAELARILKCVSCDLAWTTRKSVVEKMKHIQTCAKKHSLTDDTVRILIRQELKNSPPVSQGKGKGKPLALEPEQDAVPRTLLEDVVQDVNAKKKKRRPNVLETVKSLTETRDTILGRARQLIGDASSVPGVVTGPASETNKQPVATGGWMPPPTQAFGDSALAKHHSAPTIDLQPPDSLPVTQAFAPSKFGAASESALLRGSHRADAGSFDRQQSRPQREITSSLSPEADEFPMTQAFAPSKFSGNADSNFSLARSSANDVFPTRPSTPASPIVPVYAESFAAGTREDPVSPRVPEKRRDADVGARGVQDDRYYVDYDYDGDGENWMYDDAFLEFEPGGPIAGPSRLPERDVPSPKRVKKTKKNVGTAHTIDVHKSPPRSRSPIHTLQTSHTQTQAVEPAAAKKPRSRKKPVSTRDGPDLTDDEFNARMRDAVLQDTSLYLRVLRYEPVLFDDFMQLAANTGLPGHGQKLKARVRDFLDKQAIHFYGAEPTKSRTRRHP